MKNILKVALVCMLACSTLVLAQQSAEELARAYIDARNAYDIETTKTLLADDVKITELGDVYSVEKLGAFLAYAKAQDFRWVVDSCTTEDIGIYKVVCSYVVANSVSDALEIQPIPGGTFSFDIKDGKIALVNLVYPIEEWGPNVFSMMIAFLRANHYEDFPKLLPQSFPSGISDEGLEMWRSYTDEFVEVMGAARANSNNTVVEQIGFNFLKTRDDLDVDGMYSFLADDVVDFSVARGKAGDIEEYKAWFAWLQALNWQTTTKSCDEVGNSDGISKIVCVSEGSNEISRELDNPNDILLWGLEIKDGKIVGIYPEFNRPFINANLMPVKQYILKNHNRDYQKMYEAQDINLVRGEENLELLKTYVVEFLAAQ